MKDHNHNLVQQISEKLDSLWRYQNNYLKDAEAAGCQTCVDLFKKLHDEDQADVNMLRDEIAKHVQENRFD